MGFFYCVFLFVQNSQASFYQILETRKFVENQAQTALFLEKYSNLSSNKTDLFFPSVTNYEIMEFSAFLDYKGVKLIPENYHKQVSNTGQALMMWTPKNADGNYCVDFRPYKCYYSNEPQRNNLIVFLSDYNGETNKKSEYFHINMKLLFHYEPQFSILEQILLIG